MKTVIIGGGAAGIGAAGAVKAADPVERSRRLHRVRGHRLQPLRHSVRARQGDPRLPASVPRRESRPTSRLGSTSGTRRRSPVRPRTPRPSKSRAKAPCYDGLIVAPASTTRIPGVPGADLDGLYYVKNIRAADASGTRSSTREACRRRRGVAARPGDGHRAGAPGDRHAPRRPAPVGAGRTVRPGHRRAGPGVLGRDGRQDALEHHARGVPRDGAVGHARCATSDGEMPADLVVVATHKVPNNALAVAAGIKIGSTGGIVVDDRDGHLRAGRVGGRRRLRDPARRVAGCRCRA